MIQGKSIVTLAFFAIISMVKGAAVLNMDGAIKETLSVTLRGDPTPYEITEERLYVPGPAGSRGTLEVATHRTTDDPTKHVDEYMTRYYIFSPDVELRASIDCNHQAGQREGIVAIQSTGLLPDACWIVVDGSDDGFELNHMFSVNHEGQPRSEGFLWTNRVTSEEVRVRWTFNKRDEQVANAVVYAGNGNVAVMATDDAAAGKAATTVKNNASAGKAVKTTAWISWAAIFSIIVAVL